MFLNVGKRFGRTLVPVLMLASACGKKVDPNDLVRAVTRGVDTQAIKKAADQGIDPQVLIRAADQGTNLAVDVLDTCGASLQLARPDHRVKFLQCVNLLENQGSVECDKGNARSICIESFNQTVGHDAFERVRAAAAPELYKEHQLERALQAEKNAE